ncbi:SIR2 family NAD-dependent protein deacylase [Allonocardiopsis opalescens]|uniref:protein acetyllysine N-acetyltransferase n=1 Tax=Allonocardiopsis opalescens TaxID=1144618 RepID=A0A2T0Q476_9ACTN|nr:Sir2 family NAD-dependent protein deacetylase [Allonocardiopsis opalescens]PRX98605.1 NAD-dependent deacetylase [Allonocardiopsis opalescens]
MIGRVAAWVRGARAITVLTGAGISTDSGIPDFRGPQGVWTRDPSAASRFDFDTYRADPAVRREVWRMRAEHPAWTARPNAGHRALVAIERLGTLRALVTQNIDGLHQAAGSGAAGGPAVVEIHGTVHEVECLDCERRTPTRQVLDRVAAGEDDPACLGCGGVQKAATISFGQALKEPVLRAAVAAARDCELLLAIGSSLTVHPAAGLAELAVDSGARLVVVNAQPTPYDGLAAAVLREPIGTVLPEIAARAGACEGPAG